MSKIIKQKYQIKAPIGEVWAALVESEIIDAWGGGPAKMKDEIGFKFEFWGGDIWGKNIEVVNEEKLVQEWFGGDWAEPSIATFILRRNNYQTEVELIHENVPEDEIENFADGWKTYYLGALKSYLENKS